MCRIATFGVQILNEGRARLQVEYFQYGSLGLGLLNDNSNIWYSRPTERLGQISWKSDFHFSRNHNKRHELTNEKSANKQTRPITIPSGECKNN